MADGTVQNGTAIVAGDEITTENGSTVSARQVQRVKIDALGVDGQFRDVGPSYPLRVSLMDTVGNGNVFMAGAADGSSAVNTGPNVQGYNYVFNGTSWDRIRGDTTAGMWTQIKAALPAGTNKIGITSDATDVNRVIRNFHFNTPTAAPAAEALQSVTQWYNNAAVATTTTPAVVPAGKILRITGMRVNTASLAAAGMVMLRVRANTAGLAVIGSPLVASLQCGSQAAVAALQDWQLIEFPEGMDFPAGTGLGFTLQGYVGATGTLQSFTTFEVWGYEYTA